jgi:hypothetical protein
MYLYRYFMSQSSEFCRHNPLCCFSVSVYCYCCLFRYRLSPENLDTPSYVCISHLSHACCMPHSSHPPWFDDPNNTCWSVQVMKLLSVLSSAAYRHFLPLRSTYSSHTLFSNTLNPFSSLGVRDQVSHPYNTSKGPIILFWVTTNTMQEQSPGSSRFRISYACANPTVSCYELSVVDPEGPPSCSTV